MSDEEKDVKEKEGEEQAPEYSDIEKIAMKVGWNPNHKEGDREYVSAQEFIIRGKEIQDTMSKQLKGQNKKIDSLAKAMQHLRSHSQKVAEVNIAQVKQKLAKLRAEKRDAIEDGDNDIANDVDKQIKELESTDLTVPEDGAVPNPEFEAWLEDNSWYEEDQELRDYADAQSGLDIYSGMKAQTALKKIGEATKKAFPEKFEKPGQPQRKTSQSVESPTRKSPGKTKFTINDLSARQKKYARDFEESGVMTTAEYIEELVNIGQLKRK